MNKLLRLEIVQNRNISLLGVHIGMEKNVAIIVLKNHSPSLYGTGISIPNTGYNISYNLDEYGFVCGICIGICDNGKSAREVDEFIKYNNKLLKSNFTLIRKDEKAINEGDNIRYYYSSGLLNIDFFIDKNVRALSGKNSAMITVRFVLGRDLLYKPLEGKALAGSLYRMLGVDFVPIKWKLKIKISSIYVKYILLFVLVLICLFVYAFSHRYQVVANGRAIIDKWAGTIEEVKYR